uniref:Uncharacterized protein n=1 Tax=Setaria viridis TaxID=4556 RepID=A0A4U6V507_SETVI|nr:hypothetical protein SEVIR_4G265201v2 [Setaria viridis]
MLILHHGCSLTCCNLLVPSGSCTQQINRAG